MNSLCMVSLFFRVGKQFGSFSNTHCVLKLHSSAVAFYIRHHVFTDPMWFVGYVEEMCRFLCSSLYSAR